VAGVSPAGESHRFTISALPMPFFTRQDAPSTAARRPASTDVFYSKLAELEIEIRSGGLMLPFLLILRA
jgi:hypothetical protein